MILPDISFDGVQWWYRSHESCLHRTGAPSIIWSDGGQWYHKNGLVHRDDGPAKLFPNGTSRWYKNGSLHRDNGPAIIWSNGDLWWYKNGKLTQQKSNNGV
jgi:hypothetical protein